MKSLIKLENTIALILLSIVPVLYLITGTFEESISDYDYTKGDNVFVCFLTLAGSLFLYNAERTRKSYNLILGISIILVALFPYKEFPIIHFTGAALFYIGNVFLTIHHSSKKQRPIKIVIGLVTISALLFHFAFDYISLLWAEYIGIMPIVYHFINENNNKLD